MKINNETKVGILAVVALTLLILGFNFLKGKNVLNPSTDIYAEFTELGSLEKSNQIKLNGLVIGTVYDLDPKDKDVTSIIATIHLTRNVNIPKNSVAYISAGLIGASHIVIEKGDSKEYMQDGDTLRTKIDNGFLGDVQSQLNPALVKVKDAIDSLKVVLGGVNKILDPRTKNNISEIFTNLKDASTSLKSMLNKDNGALATTLNNASSVTGNLKKNNDSISALISSAKKMTDKFGNLPIENTLDTLESVVGQLKLTLAKLTSNDGTIGALMNDKQLYNNLNRTISSAEILLDDIRVHPKRYVNISVFGKKDKTGPLNSPTKKDSLSAGGN